VVVMPPPAQGHKVGQASPIGLLKLRHDEYRPAWWLDHLGAHRHCNRVVGAWPER
jgi:hypothetical protein